MLTSARSESLGYLRPKLLWEGLGDCEFFDGASLKGDERPGELTLGLEFGKQRPPAACRHSRCQYLRHLVPFLLI